MGGFSIQRKVHTTFSSPEWGGELTERITNRISSDTKIFFTNIFTYDYYVCTLVGSLQNR